MGLSDAVDKWWWLISGACKGLMGSLCSRTLTGLTETLVCISLLTIAQKTKSLPSLCFLPFPFVSITFSPQTQSQHLLPESQPATKLQEIKWLPRARYLGQIPFPFSSLLLFFLFLSPFLSLFFSLSSYESMHSYYLQKSAQIWNQN